MASLAFRRECPQVFATYVSENVEDNKVDNETSKKLFDVTRNVVFVIEVYMCMLRSINGFEPNYDFRLSLQSPITKLWLSYLF